MKLLSEALITQVFERFKKANPKPQSELEAPNAYCFLVSVILSAQATDKSVNKATYELYKKVKTPEQMLCLGEENLISFIKSIGLFRVKAKHIMETSKILVEKFNSEIPCTQEELMTLPGVGRKTANVILNVFFNKPTIPVDTHLFRICPKIGLAEGKNPLEVEKSLLSRIPKEYLHNAHHWLILHGRYVCTARNPKCSECLISDLCAHNEIADEKISKKHQK